MNGLVESAGIAVAISASALMFAFMSGNAKQIAFAGMLLFTSGVLLKMSWKP